MPQSQIQSEHMGIGKALHLNRLRVPPNQREYSWEREHVLDLFHDLANAISENKSSYFLGTIVLTSADSGTKEVADGQQRLATTTILLCAIRNHFRTIGDKARADAIDQKFLYEIDVETASPIPHLSLNVEDNELFLTGVLRGDDFKSAAHPKQSHRRIEEAATLAKEHVAAILRPYREKNHLQALNTWVRFISDGAQVILLSVPDELNAYVMFETLNDRGLKTSQADLVKNYLFNRAGARLSEAQHRWSQMRGAIESVETDDLTITYLRHLLVALLGHTRERDLLERVQKATTSENSALQFLDEIATSATDYVAILTPAHARWNDYDDAVRRSVKTIGELGVTVIRPLMLSITKTFAAAETRGAFRLLVSWSVRFLIVGGGRSGSTEENYAQLAQRVMKREITTAKRLSEGATFVPTDAQFADAFASATVSKAALARYYLRALEMADHSEPEPELIPNDDRVITLEHVLPTNPQSNWPDISQEVHSALCNRVGNLCLLQARANSDLKSADFSTKKSVYADSSFSLTCEIAAKSKWTAEEIIQRQKRLAELALGAWPLRVH